MFAGKRIKAKSWGRVLKLPRLLGHAIGFQIEIEKEMDIKMKIEMGMEIEIELGKINGNNFEVGKWKKN